MFDISDDDTNKVVIRWRDLPTNVEQYGSALDFYKKMWLRTKEKLVSDTLFEAKWAFHRKTRKMMEVIL